MKTYAIVAALLAILIAAAFHYDHQQQIEHDAFIAHEALIDSQLPPHVSDCVEGLYGSASCK